MAFREANNFVKIEGILSEIDLNYGSYVSKVDGKNVDYIGGSIKVLVEQEINGEANVLEVPVYMYSNKLTKAGAPNKSYESIEKVKNEFVSIAACGNKEQADKIRINGAKIKMNEFVGQNNNIVSQTRVSASFVSKAIGEFKPCATFTIEGMVSKILRAVDKDGVELDPARLNVEIIVPQWTPESASAMNVDVVPFVVTNPNVIDAIEQYWTAGQCFKASGRLNFSSRTEEVLEELGFGEAQRKVRTINVSELVITGGTPEPLEGEFAYEYNDIAAGMALRTQKLEDLKSGKKSTAKQAPAPVTSAQTLGF